VKLKKKTRSWTLNLTAAMTVMLLVEGFGNSGKAKAIPSQTAVNFAQNQSRSKLIATPESGICSSSLPFKLDTIIDAPTFSTARWGILIESLSSSTTLYSHQSDDFLIPASNVKLLTTAAALRIVGERSPRTLTSLEEWLTVINRDSDNDSADALLSRIGGQNAVRRTLTTLGVNPDSYEQVDGSGLSRHNRAKPSTFVTLLKGMYNNDESGLFYNSLPIAGVNGTLRNRFRDTLVQGRVHAKTGTLQGVKALSGYLENENYGTIAFSIVVNQSEQSGQVLTQAIDQIVLQTAQVTRCD
jgi:serine-type D-Ala-D-Ala carboxypeptidase/endopeptidase (penicillin-binding protein 4)